MWCRSFGIPITGECTVCGGEARYYFVTKDEREFSFCVSCSPGPGDILEKKGWDARFDDKFFEDSVRPDVVIDRRMV